VYENGYDGYLKCVHDEIRKVYFEVMVNFEPTFVNFFNVT